jgi:DinB family protein
MTQDPFETLARIEDVQAALRRRLSAVKPSLLNERPPSGGWSPLENVRHLIFAEQYHFARYLERGFRWRSAGVPPPNKIGERRLSPVGADPATTVGAVFDAWVKVHHVVRARCLKDPDELSQTLAGNLHHLTIHTETIERLLRR